MESRWNGPYGFQLHSIPFHGIIFNFSRSYTVFHMEYAGECKVLATLSNLHLGSRKAVVELASEGVKTHKKVTDQI